jgi:hypothetical protein
MPFDAGEEILETFGDLITRADDKARMEHWLSATTPIRAARGDTLAATSLLSSRHEPRSMKRPPTQRP